MKKRVIWIAVIIVILLIVTTLIVFGISKAKNNIQGGNIFVGGFNAFIPGGQSRNLSNYDSFEDWKKDLKKDMDEHNEKAKEEEKKYLEIAEINAKDYIKNKYGFEPVFIEKKAEYTTSLVGGFDDAFVGNKYNYTGNVILKFQKDDKDYYVLISGHEGDKLGYDNYQYEQISKEIISRFNTLVNLTAYNAEIQYGKTYKISDKLSIYNLVNTYFDEKNLKDAINEDGYKYGYNYGYGFINSKPTGASILMEYGNDVDLNKLNIDFISSNSKVLILKYKSYNDFKQAKEDYDAETKRNYGKSHSHIIDSDILGFDMPEKALHIQEYLAIENSNKEIKKINVIECDGLYAVQLGRNIPVEINLSEIIDSGDNFKEATLHRDYEHLSSAYSIKYDISGIENVDRLRDYDLFIYFPVDKLKDISKYKENDWKNRFSIGIQSLNKGIAKYNEAGGGTSLSITHFNNKEYLTLEFSDYYGMKPDGDNRFILLGYSID